MLAELPGDEVLVGQLVRRLRRRSFGGLLLLLGAFGLVPGVSTFAGLAMLLPGIQMLVGLRAPLLPRLVRRRSVGRDNLRMLGEKAVPLLQRMERYVRPRWLTMTQAPITNLIGLLVVGLALVVMLPLPFSNAPPAVALVCLSLGLLERDGLFVSVGILVGLIALVIGGFMTSVALKTIALIA